jgi:hypothetical protein
LPSEETFGLLKNLYFEGKLKQVEGYLKGKECCIIGGGSSLKNFGFDKLKDKFTIAINHSVYYFKSDAVLFIDRKFLKDDRQKTLNFLANYEGIIFASFRSKYFLENIKGKNIVNFSLNRHSPQLNFYNGLYSGKSSGLCALNLAIQMNPDKIYLLGFDYDAESETKHFYNEKGEDTFGNEVSYTSAKCKSVTAMYRMFGQWKDLIRNCNPNSKLRYFETEEL